MTGNSITYNLNTMHDRHYLCTDWHIHFYMVPTDTKHVVQSSSQYKGAWLAMLYV